MVFDRNGTKIFSVRGYEFVPGGISDGEFAFVGASGDRTLFHANNLDCIVPRETSERVPSRLATIGKYNIKYSVSNYRKCVYGSYMCENKIDRINLFGTFSKESTQLIELTANKTISGLLNLDADFSKFKGNWLSAPPGKILPVK
jgi:hypothetical protein